ncbi:MAG: glutamate synthase subunit beta [Candidatus Omnitrophota bacterium]
MGDIKGFLKIRRQETKYRPVCSRSKDYREVISLRSDDASKEQASRCMDCATPFCHWGCPVGNYIPEWNDALFKGQWKKAFKLIDITNNFPEFTGRLCPATCEHACVLGINDDPVTIRENELAIIEYAFEAGFVRANPPRLHTGKKIAVVGSGAAGLAAASQLNKAGHTVTVFERDNKIGGILRYGIPDFKLEKWVLDRRLAILEKEGIEFITGVNVGIDYKTSKLNKEFDAVCLACGSRTPRDLSIEGRNLKGVHFAMDYLMQSNKRVVKEKIEANTYIDAKDKRVVVIGGGDTGADCVGTAHRQGARCVVQIEVMPQPPLCRSKDYPWPKYPLLLKTSTSHEEGGQRQWSILTKRFIGENGILKKISCVKVEFVVEHRTSNVGLAKTCPVMKEIPGSDFEIDADLVILAVGFVGPERAGLLTELGVVYDARGNVETNENYMTSVDKVFSAGDMHRGQSLLVWAIAEGRRMAYYVDVYLMGESNLPLI